MSNYLDARKKLSAFEEEVRKFCEKYRRVDKTSMASLSTREDDIRRIDAMSFEVNAELTKLKEEYIKMLDTMFKTWFALLLRRVEGMGQEYQEAHLEYFTASRASGIGV